MPMLGAVDETVLVMAREQIRFARWVKKNNSHIAALFY
jgi:hypothetical protein